MLLCIPLIFAACQSTQYREPIKFNQDEVAQLIEAGSRDLKTGYTESLGPRRYTYCSLKNNVGECARVICKEDKNERTGLACEAYLPLDSEGTTDTKKVSDSKLIENSLNSAVSAFRSSLTLVAEEAKRNPESAEKSLEKLCWTNGVFCKRGLNNYPEYKISLPNDQRAKIYETEFLAQGIVATKISVYIK